MIQEQTGRSCTLEGLYQEILGGGKRKKSQTKNHWQGWCRPGRGDQGGGRSPPLKPFKTQEDKVTANWFSYWQQPHLKLNGIRDPQTSPVTKVSMTPVFSSLSPASTVTSCAWQQQIPPSHTLHCPGSSLHASQGQPCHEWFRNKHVPSSSLDKSGLIFNYLSCSKDVNLALSPTEPLTFIKFTELQAFEFSTLL